MNKLTLHLNRSEWTQLTATVLEQSSEVRNAEDKYMKAILFYTLLQVYVKLHNKLHSLQPVNNRLNLTYPEASVLAMTLLELNSDNYMIVNITGLIDQKLT